MVSKKHNTTQHGHTDTYRCWECTSFFEWELRRLFGPWVNGVVAHVPPQLQVERFVFGSRVFHELDSLAVVSILSAQPPSPSPSPSQQQTRILYHWRLVLASMIDIDIEIDYDWLLTEIGMLHLLLCHHHHKDRQKCSILRSGEWMDWRLVLASIDIGIEIDWPTKLACFISFCWFVGLVVAILTYQVPDCVPNVGTPPRVTEVAAWQVFAVDIRGICLQKFRAQKPNGGISSSSNNNNEK